MTGKILIFSFLIFTFLSVSAQDKIIKTGKDTIRCVIREVGDEEIRYSMDGYRSDLVFGIDKNKV
jgi:hypothetical protein